MPDTTTINVTQDAVDVSVSTTVDGVAIAVTETTESVSLGLIQYVAAPADGGGGGEVDNSVLTYLKTVATGSITLTTTSKTVQYIDPNGVDRTVTLPSAAAKPGLWFVIRNIGTVGDLLVTDGVATLIVAPGDSLVVHSDSEAWFELW